MNRYWLQRHNADTECIKNAVRSMNEDIRDLSKYCDELEERIDKVIEYIEGSIEEWENVEDEYFQGIVMEDKFILDLLKGEE